MKKVKRKCWQLLKLVGLVILAIPYYVLVKLALRGEASAPHQQFASAIADRADQDRYIILAMTDEAFIDMAINFYEASLRAHHIANFLFVGVGNKTCDMLSRRMIPCFYYADDPSAGKSSSYGQKDFIRKMNIRTDMILEALAANFTVIHTDTDVAFLRNPLNKIKVAADDIDVAALWDVYGYNAGFLVVRPSAASQRLYRLTQRLTRRRKTTDDQKALNRAIKMMGRYKQVRIGVLDQSYFFNGMQYFEKADRIFPKNKSCEPPKCPLVVHNNWIVSKEAKIYRFREHLMWLYDGDDQYYSSRTRKYVTYMNPTPPERAAANDVAKTELSALKTALTIGHLLNRTVILPRFHCGSKGHHCPLNSLLHVKTFDGHFPNSYRENSFLLHPKVPGAVKQGLVNVQFVSNDRKSRSADITRLFGELTGKVLNFSSLPEVTIDLNDNLIDLEFRAKIKTKFRRSHYRQIR